MFLPPMEREQINHHAIYLRYQKERHEYYVGQTNDIEVRNKQFLESKRYAGKTLEESRHKDMDSDTNMVDSSKWETFIVFQGYCSKYEIDIREKRCIQIMYELIGEGNLLNDSKDYPNGESAFIIDGKVQDLFRKTDEIHEELLSSPCLVLSILRSEM